MVSELTHLLATKCKEMRLANCSSHPEADSDLNGVIRHLQTERQNWQCSACPMTFASCENFQWELECLLGDTNATQIKLNIAHRRALMPNEAEAAAALGPRLH